MLVVPFMALRNVLFACSLTACACGGSPASEAKSPVAQAPQPSPATQATSGVASPPETPSARTSVSPTDVEKAHRLVMATIACWLGGVWSDAEGATEEARAADAERRCHDLIATVYGADDKARYERLRAVEAAEISELKEKILSTAHKDGVDAARQQQLATFFDAVSAAERETMYARRAADRIKKDIEGERKPGKRGPDEAQSPGPLGESKAFDALLKLDVGDLTHEARAIAILCAMDRMEIARGLPKHLKVYVVERPYEALFGVTPPEVPKDPSASLKGGAWLAYISSVANAAGHPVSDRAKSLPDRELLAWGGALAGLADKLRTEAQDLSGATDLKRVSLAVVQRLDNEYRDSESAVQREPEPAGPPRHLGKPSR